MNTSKVIEKKMRGGLIQLKFCQEEIIFEENKQYRLIYLHKLY